MSSINTSLTPWIIDNNLPDPRSRCRYCNVVYQFAEGPLSAHKSDCEWVAAVRHVELPESNYRNATKQLLQEDVALAAE